MIAAKKSQLRDEKKYKKISLTMIINLKIKLLTNFQKKTVSAYIQQLLKSTTYKVTFDTSF